MTTPAFRVAVLVPCFNEETAVATVVADFRKALPAAEIYVYDNNSSDQTAARAREAGAVVRTELRQGKGNVVRRMFADIEADIYVLVDGDDTYDAGASLRMIQTAIESGADRVGFGAGETGQTEGEVPLLNALETVRDDGERLERPLHRPECKCVHDDEHGRAEGGQAGDVIPGIEHGARMAVGSVDHHEIDAGRDQLRGALEAFIADGGGGGDAQTPLLVLAGVRIGHRLLHVLDRDQPHAAILIVDHEQLFDAMLMQHALRLVLAHALAHRDEFFMGHQLRHPLARIGGKAHVAVGQDADELAGLAGAAAGHHGDAGDAVILHQRQRIGKRSIRRNRQRIFDSA